jgi:hypothetical protein
MIYDQIIFNLNEIIGNNKTSENVYNTFEFAMNVIQNKEISFEINPKINPELDDKMTNTVLGGMYFRKDKLGRINIVFGQKYLDTYNINSSIHYTILMHEFRHLNDYYQNKNSFFQSNEKERFQYELNAVQIEAEFIKYYLFGKYNLSRCENYILESYKKDNLESWTILKQKESADIFRILNDIEVKYKQNIISQDRLVKELVQKVDQLLAKKNQFLSLFDIYHADANKFSRFGHFIRLKTFEKYLRYIFKYESEMKEILLKNHEFEVQCKTIIDKIIEYDHVNHIYSSSLDNYFENDFINKLCDKNV